MNHVLKELNFTHEGQEYALVVEISKRALANARSHPAQGSIVSLARVFNLTEFRKQPDEPTM